MTSQTRQRIARLSRRDFLKAGGLLSLAGVLGKAASQSSSINPKNKVVGQPNFLVLVLDTLSAGNMSLYGYARKTTPNIDRFAEQALVFHKHYAGGNFTPPGTASLLTGVYPWSHRCLHPSSSIRPEYRRQNIFAMLPENYYSLAYTHNSLAMSLLFRFQEALSELMPFEALSLQESNLSGGPLWKDYPLADWSETIIRGVGHPPASLFLSLLDPLRQRPRADLSEKYAQAFPHGIPSANYSRYFVLEDATNWLINNLPEQPSPFFAYFHLMPPHEPYSPRAEFVNLFQDDLAFPAKPEHFFSEGESPQTLWDLRRQYDEYLAYADAEFGRLYDALTRSGQLENTYLILTSDHGQIFERGIHGHITETLFEPLLHIPLLIAPPGQTQRKDIHSLTSAVDLLPTWLNLLGRPVPEWVEGLILPGLGGEADPMRSVFSLESKEASPQGAIEGFSAAILEGDHKLIHYAGYPGFDEIYELYELSTDSQENFDLYKKLPETGEYLRSKLQQALKEHRFSNISQQR